jgi:RNA polymerase sigma-70 factor (ECF subfamily)
MKARRRFEKMYQTYADDIFRYLLVHVNDVAVAEDLTADTFTKAWKKIDSYNFLHPRGWLYAIAKNTLTDYWRKKKSLPLDEEIEIEDNRPSITTELDKKLDAKRTLTAMKVLSPEMRSVVTLRFFLGYSAKQAGEALGISEQNVRVLQFRALRKLREELS